MHYLRTILYVLILDAILFAIEYQFNVDIKTIWFAIGGFLIGMISHKIDEFIGYEN